jgi:hypothetical protein
MNRVFGNLGFQIFGDVFDDAGTAASSPNQFATATRAGGKLLRLVAVDDRGDGA